MLLIDHGAKVDAQGVNARYPLHYAAANGHVEIMKCLLDKGAKLNVLDSCVDDQNPKKYDDITAHEFLIQRLKDIGVL